MLQPLYTSVLVPQTVAGELQQADTPDAVRTWIAQPPDWCEIRPDPPSDPSLQFLDPGERAAITLALSLDADRLLIDEWEGRAEAERRHLFVTGTLGILAEAHQQGLLDFEAGAHAASSDELLYVGGTRQPRPSAAIDRKRGSVIVGRELRRISLVVNSDTGSL